ncbi:MAG: hypothetical protein LC754_08605, partial [Acidobacteria bacterium]|nr:hypothetical protein [Acidobacteriota bacterium]
NWGFIDEGAGTVSMPIEQAKQMYLQSQQQKAQPSQAPAQPASAGREATPGEQIPAASSSGRTPEKKNQ